MCILTHPLGMQRRARCASLLLASCLFAPLAPGCGLTLDLDPGDEAGVAEAGIFDASSIDAGPQDAAPFDAGDGGNDADLDASRGGECETEVDCDALYGAAPCGAWVCSPRGCEVHCADCVDADLDGYGVGSGCAGLDCDDADDFVTSDTSRACYGGPAGTLGVGECAAGIEECIAGVWLPCTGEVRPNLERCDGLDDDCNGIADDSGLVTTCGLGACANTASGCAGAGPARCTPLVAPSVTDACDGIDEDCDGVTDEDCGTCVWVSLAGDDAAANPTSPSTPFRSVQTAIDWAASDRLRPQRVCLMSSSCGTSIGATFMEAVSMRDGVAVQGSHGPSGAACAFRTTAIRNTTAQGVLFDSGVRAFTELSRVSVFPMRAPGATTTGITIDGASGAVISDVRVERAEVAAVSIGIDVRAGAAARVIGSEVFSGRATMEAVGLRSEGSRVELLDNCDAFDSAGRCRVGCRFDSGQGFHGHYNSSAMAPRPARSYAVQLIDSPGSLIRGSATCGQQAGVGAGIRIEGNAAGTRVTTSFIAGYGPQLESYGIELMACGDTAPVIDSNFEINAESPPLAVQTAIRAHAGCHPFIAGNTRIATGLEGAGNPVTIHCGDASAASRCVIVGNPDIIASSAGVPTSAMALRCEAGSCARIEDNIIEGGPSSGSSVGVSLEGPGGGATIVDRNTITGGCGALASIGLQAVGASASIANTILHGGQCLGATAGSRSIFRALVVIPARASVPFVVHSSTLLAGGYNGMCEGRVIEIAAAPSGGVPVGLYRNLVLVPGPCAVAYGVYEAGISTDPVAFDHVLFDPGSAMGTPTLYRDEGGVAITTAPAIEALTDMFVTSIMAGPAGLRAPPNDVHLVSGSACIGVGSVTGMPPIDRDRVRRMPGRPDLGAYVGP